MNYYDSLDVADWAFDIMRESLRFLVPLAFCRPH